MKTLCAAVVMMLSLAAAAPAADRLDAARMFIFDRDWPKAVAELRRVVEDRQEPLRDEAAFWLAHSLFQMGNPPEALRVIEMLERDHARSRWVLPAQSLRVQIAAHTGRTDLLWRVAVQPAPRPPAPPRTPVPPRTAAPAPPAPGPRVRVTAKAPPALQAFTMTDIRIEALNGLMRRDPERAVPVLREIVVEEIETPQARRALLVLGLSPHQGARETVMHFARTGPDALRVVAVEQMGRWPSPAARRALATVYPSGSDRVKLEVLRSLGEARADRELIRIARDETDQSLRGFAVAQLRQVDTAAARAFLGTIK
ncbi:MAG TPA: hypothetical protein VFZ36_13195 [Vicinamibacterales bacterium]